MIGPTSYERWARNLIEAGHRTELRVLTAGKRSMSLLVVEPVAELQARVAFLRAARAAAVQWVRDGVAWANQDLVAAYTLGLADAEKELARLGLADPEAAARATARSGPLSPVGGPGLGANLPPEVLARFQRWPDHALPYGAFRQAAIDRVERSAFHVLRDASDFWREVQVTTGSRAFREGSTLVRRQLSEELLDAYAKRGVTGMVYSNGANVSLTAYSEMVGRTISGRAALSASLSRYQEHGYDLVIVSKHFGACKLCRPWERSVLSQGGLTPGYPTLDEAVADGLFHPNCAHNVAPYVKGVTTVRQPLPQDPAIRSLVRRTGSAARASEAADLAQQQQRYIERQIRYWKRRNAVRDRAGRLLGGRKVREWQGRMRDHLREHPYLRRKRERERWPTRITRTIRRRSA